MRAALLPLLLPAFLLSLSNTARGMVDSAGSIPTQTRYLRCPGVPATVNGNYDMDVKTVTKSSLECSILCSLRKQCWGITVCTSYKEGKDGMVCEMWVGGVPFTQCPEGSGYIRTDCRFLLKDAGLCTITGNAPVTEMTTTITGDAAMTEVTTTMTGDTPVTEMTTTITGDAAMTEVTKTLTGDTTVTEVTTTMTGDTPVTEVTTTMTGDTPVTEVTTTLTGDTPVTEVTTTMTGDTPVTEVTKTLTGDTPVTEVTTTMTGDTPVTEVTKTLTGDTPVTEVTTTMTGDTPVTEVTTTMTGDTPVTEVTKTLTGDTPVTEVTTTMTGDTPVTEVTTTVTGDTTVTKVTTTVTGDTPVTEVTTTMTGDTPVTEVTTTVTGDTTVTKVTTTVTGDTPVTQMTTTIAGDTPASVMTTTDAAATTTMLVCQNGGTVKGTSCRCPLPYGGQTCQRYMRDCTEGFEHENTKSGAYFIQPVGSPNAFKVRCNFKVAIGVTQVMTRKDMPGQWHDKTWQEVKDGFGDDLVTTPNSWNFFIGLEKLHQISRQALYSFHIFFYWGSNKDGCASYKNFTVSPESSRYKMDYDTFYKLTNPGEVNYLLAKNQADDGFNNTAPRSFSASDNDLNSCFTTTGAVGWYDSNCQGMSLFSNTLRWPVAGQNKTLLWVMLNLIRESDYY